MSMKRPRISLQTLLLLITCTGFAAAAFVTHASKKRAEISFLLEKKSLQLEIQRLRSELGYLPIANALQASLIRVDTPESRASYWREHFRARVYLPELPAGGQYFLRYVPLKKCPNGYPGWGGIEPSNRLIGWIQSREISPGEHTIDVRLFRSRDDQLQLDVEVLGSSDAHDFNDSFFDQLGPYEDSFIADSSVRVGGAKAAVFETTPFEPFTVFKLRGLQPDNGVKLYIEPSMAGVEEGEATAEALRRASEAEPLRE